MEFKGNENRSRNYDYNRDWIEQRISQLAKVFSIEVYAYAVMSNHYHLVVYSDPRAPQSWSDDEVAGRWLKAFPGKLNNPKYQTQRALGQTGECERQDG